MTQPVRADGSVNHPMIAGEGDGHELGNFHSAVLCDLHTLLAPANCQDSALGSIDNGGEFANALRAQGRDGKGAALIFLGGKPVASGLFVEFEQSGVDGGEGTGRDIGDDGGDEAGGRGDGHANVYAVVLANDIALPSAINCGTLAKGIRSSLEDECVQRGLFREL